MISTAGISLEVKDLDAARRSDPRTGRQVRRDHRQPVDERRGASRLPAPQPLDGSSAQYAAPTPAARRITLRIPAEKLAAAERDIAALGRVISQTSSQDDVTQQHVDMKARLKNLQAEEARLRTFFLKAKRVSEMLAIEQELARVRGEIESMQAQIDVPRDARPRSRRSPCHARRSRARSCRPRPAAGASRPRSATAFEPAAAVVRGMITMLLALSPVIAAWA